MKLNELGPTIVQVCQLWKQNPYKLIVNTLLFFLHRPGVDTHHICNNSSYIDSYIMI